MLYEQFDEKLYKRLKELGYRYIIQWFEPMDPATVGHEETGTYSYLEVTPVKEVPKDFDMDKGCYYDIDSPEAIGFIDDAYDTYLWVKKEYL